MTIANRTAPIFVRSQSTDCDSITGYKRSARALKIRQGLLPPPVLLGARASGFLLSELESVGRARATGADDDAIRALVKRLIAARSEPSSQVA